MMNFTDVYEIPQLTNIDRICYAPGLIFGPLNIIICTVFTILCFGDKTRFHLNFRILRFHLIVAFYLNAITHIIIIATVFAEDLVIPKINYNLWFISVVLGGGVATELMRYLWICILIERCFATYFCKVYENNVKQFIWLPIVLSIVAYGGAMLFSFLLFFKKIPAYVEYSWSLTFDLLGLLTVILLHKVNQHKRKLKAHSNVQLTQRYQIVENIRILNIIFPIIIAGIFFTLFNTLVRFTMTQINPFKFLFRNAIVLYYVSLNLFELIAMILWIRKDARYQKKLSSLYKRLFYTKTCDQSTSSQNHVIKNVEGDTIFMEQNATAHFSTLDLMWSEASVNPSKNRG